VVIGEISWKITSKDPAQMRLPALPLALDVLEAPEGGIPLSLKHRGLVEQPSEERSRDTHLASPAGQQALTEDQEGVGHPSPR
jgi:hypothetical protein